MIKEISIDFINFIKHPKDFQFQLKFKDKIKFILVLLLFEVLFTITIIIPVYFIVNKIEKIKYQRIDYTETLLSSLFLFVIIIPLFEELIFRYFLRYKGLKTKILSRKTWDKIFPFLVYFMSVSFGLIHIFNYNNQNFVLILIILSPFIVLSQIFGGFILTYTRVRINFLWGVILHSIWNFLVIILIPLLGSQLIKPYEEVNESYKIKITEKPFYDTNSEQFMLIDSSLGSIKKIKIKQYSIQHLLDTLFNKNTYYVDDVLINLEFTTNDEIDKKEFVEILKKKYDIIE